MNKKLLLFSIILIILIIAGTVFLAPLYTKSPTPVSVSEISLENKQIIDNTNPFIIEISYPYIEGDDNFNNKTQEIINKEIEEFKSISLENDQAVKETDPEGYAEYQRKYNLNINYDQGYFNENIVSVVFNINNFTGGAHGASYFIPLNYNLNKNQEIKISDLFVGEENYLDRVSNYCIADLTKQITELTGSTDGLWIETGASSDKENFSTFLLKKDEIIFYFPQYQVAPYALGSFKVIMPI